MDAGRLAAGVQSVAINLVGSKLDGAPTEVARMVSIIQALLANADLSADCVPACPIPAHTEFILDDHSDFDLDDEVPLTN